MDYSVSMLIQWVLWGLGSGQNRLFLKSSSIKCKFQAVTVTGKCVLFRVTVFFPSQDLTTTIRAAGGSQLEVQLCPLMSFLLCEQWFNHGMWEMCSTDSKGNFWGTDVFELWDLCPSLPCHLIGVALKGCCTTYVPFMNCVHTKTKEFHTEEFLK